MVKLSSAILSSVAIVGALSGSADDVLPSRFNFDRYTRMVDQSPFAIATAAALPEATPDFAKDLYIANAARSPEADMVTLMSSSDRNFKKYLTTREPVDGYSLAHIEWSEDLGKTKVTISKDGKLATLAFNESLLSQGGSAGRPVANQMSASMPILPSATSRQASRSHPRGVTERTLKKAQQPASNADDDSRSVPSAPGVPVPPSGVALPRPVGGTRDLSEKEPSG